MRFVLGSRHGQSERFGRRYARAECGPLEPVQEAPHPVLPARIAPIAFPTPAPEESQRAPVPDLLNVIPTSTVDAQVLRRALAFSFIAEDDGGVLASALAAAPLAPSDFDPECFYQDLFLSDFVQSCMAVHIAGRAIALDQRYLLRVLSQPPSDGAITAQRQLVWRELSERPEARTALEAVYTAISELRRLFEGQGRMGIRGEQARRRLDLLLQLHRTFALMDAPALHESGSVLKRMASFGRYVRASAGHARLRELLQYENERAFADLTLQLGADGSVRGLRLSGLRENTQSRYHVSLARQWAGRFLLWIKGYRVTDGEIIDRWLDQVFEGVAEFVPPLVQLQGDLEVYLAGLAFRDLAQQRGLATCFATRAEAELPGEVDELFNPLLLGLGLKPVTCSLTLGGPGQIALITGPNSGGKTRLLQALGILHLCAQAGMYLPARRARLHPVPGIFASLIQSASAEQAEGRLGTELLRIRMLFERAAPGCLVLVDELCSGTSPSEGEEMFTMVLELLHELGPSAFVSTHFLKFAAALSAAPDALALRFWQVELDAEQRPTYRFVAGVAETSLAKQTASRLGVTREELRALLAAKKR